MSMLRVDPRRIRMLRAGTSIKYLFRDEFTDAHSAGALNGTLSDSGHTRNVVDTTGKFSTVSGQFQTLANAVSGERLWYAIQTRVRGKTLFSRHLPLTSTSHDFGFSTLNTLVAGDGNSIITAGNLSIRTGAVPVVGAYNDSTQLTFASVMRSQGMFYFIKGGNYRIWTLLYMTATGTADMYVRVREGTVTGAYSYAMIDYLRIPQNTFTITPLAADDFNRANGAIGSTGGNSAQEPGGSGLAWSQENGAWTISSNRATGAPTSGTTQALVETGQDDVMIECIFTRSAGAVGLVARWTDASNYLACYHNGTNIIFTQTIGGTPTTLLNTAVTFASLTRMVIDLKGSKARVYYNEALVGAELTLTGTTGTKHGLMTDNAGNQHDNFAVWLNGYNGEYENELNALNPPRPFYVDFGDSKTARHGWQELINFERGLEDMTVAIGGTTSVTWRTAIDSWLETRAGSPLAIFYNLGVNDLAPGTSEATYKSNTLYILDAFHATFPAALIYVARVWQRGYDTQSDTMAGWLDYCIAQRPSFCRAGPDERVWVKGSDDGATMTADGVHYSAAGLVEAANQWKAFL